MYVQNVRDLSETQGSHRRQRLNEYSTIEKNVKISKELPHSGESMS